ncbi:MAG: Gfo/Idh/MocA family oxidoreductase [Ruminococcaceae bacterium]|nr:Gfo/Idh/MocA family oxidoreductase [Oscillospiraceae bacterium]
MKNNGIIRFATVGTSAICEQFIASAKTVPSLKHTVVYSRSYEKGLAFATKTGCEKVYTNIEELAASSEIDAVYIASPNVFHSIQSRIFLKGGKHVICEKPIAVSYEEYLETKRIADQNGLIYMDAMKSCNIPWHKDIENAVKRLGNIAVARIDFCQRSSRYDAFMAGIPQNIFDMSLHAGALMDLGVYCVYAAVDLLGEPKNITAGASFFENGCDHSGTTVFDYGNFQAVLTYSKAGQSALGSEIIGENGSLKISSISQFVGVSSLDKNGEETEIVPYYDRIKVMSGEAACFADFINGKDLQEYKKRNTLCEKVMRCMDEIKQSAGIVYGDIK